MSGMNFWKEKKKKQQNWGREESFAEIYKLFQFLPFSGL